jgi:hypothetical protein
MNLVGLPPSASELVRQVEIKPLSPLSFTPEQARREARKLHQFRDELKNRRSVQDTGIRSSPLGRDD